MVTLLGNGFIGSKYSSIYPCIINPRNDFTPKSDELLYFISTVHNYNIHTDPFLDINTNLNILIKTLENCKNNKNTVFNFASSWYVYGSIDNKVTEESHCSPQGFYSITKYTAEQMLIEYCKTFGLKYRIFRFANVLGVGDKISDKKNVLAYLIRKLVRNEDITLYNGGKFYRDYIHVEDVCHAIHLLLTTPTNSIINVGTGTSYLFSDIINYVHEKVKSKSRILVSDNNKIPIQGKNFCLNCDKLYSYGFTPKYNLYEIIDELIQEWEKNEKISYQV